MSAHRFVAAPRAEAVKRLALGLEPIDWANGGRVSHVVKVALDRVPMPPTTFYNLQPWEWLGDRLPRFPRHPSCRYALIYERGLRTTVEFRLFDGGRRYVARRLKVAVAAEDDVVAPDVDPARPPVPLANRALRPRMYPGAAYNVSESSTGLRGRVQRAGQPMRWARVEAYRRDTGELVGRAHGDDRGDFLLVVGRRGDAATAPPDPIPLSIRVFGPLFAPTPAYPGQAEADDLWDVPQETAAVPQPAGGDDVILGFQQPPGYQPSTGGDIPVDLPLGRFSSAGVNPFAFST